MINIIMESFGDGFWATIYAIFAIYALFVTVPHFIISIWDSPYWRLKFIKKAQSEGRATVGKLTCLTLNREKKGDYYLAEYMYMVDGKRQFVTYKMSLTVKPDDNDLETMNADIASSVIKVSLPLFYKKTKRNKIKVLSKMEIFSSTDTVNQWYTPKSNKYRDVEKDWYEAIDLRYSSIY